MKARDAMHSPKRLMPLSAAGIILAGGLALTIALWLLVPSAGTTAILGGGVLASLLLARLAYLESRNRPGAVRLAESMTAALGAERARLQAVADLSSDWYWLQDSEYRFIDVVGKAHEKASLDFVRVAGKTRWEVAPEALETEAWARHRADLQARRPFTLVYPVRNKDGEMRWIESKGLPRHDEHGVFLGYHGTSRNVSERIATVAALKRQSAVLQTTLEHMNQGISVVDADLRLIGWNRRFLELLDFPETLAHEDALFEDFIRYNVERGEYGAGDTENIVRERVEIARRFLPHRFKRTRPDGTVIEVIGTPLPGGGMVTTYTDVTEQERTQEAIRSERDFRQRLIESVPGIFYLIGGDGRFLLWNRNFEQVTGYSDEEMARAHPLDFFEGQDRELIAERIGVVFESGSATAEALFRAGDGTKRPYFFTGERITLEDGRPGLIGVGFDISERKRAEEDLARQTTVLQATLEAMDQGISVVDADLHMTALNKKFCELLEFPEEMAREGASFADFARHNALRGEYGPCDVEEKVREMVERARHPQPHRFRRTRPNGRIVEVRGNTLPGGGFVTTYTDVTEQEQAQEAVRQSEQRYRTLVEMSPDAVFVHRKRIILLANEAALRLWGLPPDGQVIGWDVLDFIAPESHAEVIRRIESLESEETPGRRMPTTEQIYRRVDGSAVPVESSATRIELADGPAVLSVIRDISDRKLAEDALRQLTETLEQRVRERTADLEASNQELESFSYSVSHDLRAPLRALHGFSHLLEEEYGPRLDENGLNYLHRIRSASERMGKLIDDLIGLARISRQDLRRVDVDLTAIATEIAQTLQEQAPQRKVVWNIAPGMRAMADPGLANVLLDNLLSNAWKFTAECDDAQIEFGRLPTDGGKTFYVRDNGAGFEMIYADKLFQPFQRLHNPKRFEGTGIGLATVQRIVRRHGGHVRAESTPGKGTTFSFTLS